MYDDMKYSHIYFLRIYPTPVTSWLLVAIGQPRDCGYILNKCMTGQTDFK